MEKSTSKFEQQIAESTQALLNESWKFSDKTIILKVIAALLYFTQRGFLTIRQTVSGIDGIVISSLNYYKRDKKDSVKQENEYIVINIPQDDPMFSYVKLFESLNNGKYRFHFIALHHYVHTISASIMGPESFLEAFDIAVSDYFSMIDPTTRYSLGEFVQPNEFTELISRLLDVKGKTVLNPFPGLMKYYTTLEGYSQYTGMVRFPVFRILNKIRLHLAGFQNNVSCINWNVAKQIEGEYDIIIATPPLGGYVTVGIDNHHMRADVVCLELFESTTTQQGVLFSYVTPSLLFDGKEDVYKMRRKITEQNLLDAVIILPTNMLWPYTCIPVAAIQLKKGRRKDDPIKMIDASKLTIGNTRVAKLDVGTLVKWLDEMPNDDCKYVSTEEIRNNDYTWSVNNYIGLQKESFPEGYMVIKAGDVVNIVVGKHFFDDKKGHLVRISTLSNDGSDCKRSVDFFEETTELANTTKVSEPVILISTVLEPRPTYCEASEENPIFVRPNIIACSVKEAYVSPTYLCLELSKRIVPSVGSTMQRLTHSVLLDTKIALPSIGHQRSLEEQNNLYRAAAENYKMAKAKELGLQEVIDKMKTEYMMEVRQRKHDMKQSLQDIRSIPKLLKSIAKEFPNAISDKLNTYAQRLQLDCDTLSEIANHLADEEIFSNPEILNVDEILSQFVVNEERYDIIYQKDNTVLNEMGITAPKIKIGRADFLRLVNNIISNAIEHGFVNIDYHYTLFIYLSFENGLLTIIFKNDGEPFPEGMNKEKYGMRNVKGKDSKGKGEGGNIVKNIVDHYGGDYDIFSDKSNSFVVIKLPIYQEDE
ncbi:MAG: N-6 DNA methylase [Bacteroidales bacterium]|nr:N-6 DNA methylase [Bacteroidales bacterium]